MVLYDAQGNSYVASKVKRPRLYSPLKCWDFEHRTIDSKQIDMFLERGMGKAFYFEIERQWYRMSFYRRGDFTSPDAFDIENFSTVRSATICINCGLAAPCGCAYSFIACHACCQRPCGCAKTEDAV